MAVYEGDSTFFISMFKEATESPECVSWINWESGNHEFKTLLTHSLLLPSIKLSGEIIDKRLHEAL